MKRSHTVSKTLTEPTKTLAEKELKLGYLNLTDGMFDQAKTNFLLTLEYDHTCADAFWGLMLVKFGLKNEDELFSNPMLYKSATFLPECQKALENADENQKKIYDGILEHIREVNEGDNY